MPNLEVNAYELILLSGCIMLFIASISAAFNNSFDDFSWKHITTWLFVLGSLLTLIGYVGYKVYAYYHPYAWLD
ncbi:hypothetical protein [Psychrobacter sp. FME13]|uniref:hypothetical protein n=1 Tax=unclassified Psychrobacter TaxID=196806 RepID=UPI0017877F3C|nr:hypothetical protein [Psychrobacter sp. FME13]MBE0441898.1 hypothetical protein [Psychrobacter sp. FME13]